MKKHMAQYLNEILSITIMLLLAIALVAGQGTHLATGADGGSDPVVYPTVRVAGGE